MASWSTGASAAGGVDATYGQRSVFGAVGRGVVATAPAGDADLECEDEQAALAYLAGVQIPHVVLAPAYGPQAFPPRSSAPRPRPKRRVHAAAVPTSGDDALESSATINKKRRRRRRLRHWDELDDGGGGDIAVGAGDVDHENGNGRTSKRQRMTAPAAAAAALSYDDDGGSAGADTTPTPTSTGGGGYSGRTVRTYDELDTGSSEEETDEEEQDDEDDDDDDAYEPQLDRSLYDNGVGDARGYYPDGAYIAAAAEDDGGVPSVEYGPALPGTDTRDEDAAAAAAAATAAATAATAARFAAAYRARLLAHFAGLRALLRRPPPPAAVAALPPGHDTAVGTLSARSGVFRRWLLLLQTTDPLPAQVAALDTVAVLRVLRVLQRGGLLQQRGGTPRTSRWLWALLARLPARGELDHRAVGCLRDVAKQAVQLLAAAAAAAAGRDDEQEAPADETALQEEAEGEEDLDDLDIAMDLESLPDEEDRDEAGQGGEDKTAAAAASEHEAATEQEAGEQTDAMQQRATLEMVLAVVGEFYGQRDLLAFRAWP